MNATQDLLIYQPHTIQILEPDPQTVYTMEATTLLADVPRHTILVYYKYGLISPVMDPESAGGYYFNDEAILLLRHIKYLRATEGINLPGIKMILNLSRQVESLQTELRFLRR